MRNNLNSINLIIYKKYIEKFKKTRCMINKIKMYNIHANFSCVRNLILYIHI